MLFFILVTIVNVTLISILYSYFGISLRYVLYNQKVRLGEKLM